MDKEIEQLVEQVISDKKRREERAEQEENILISIKNGELPDTFVGLLIALGGGHGRKAKLAVELRRSIWEVNNWYRRDYVPEWAWADIMRLSAKRRLLGVTTDYLHKICKKGREIRKRGKHQRLTKDEARKP